MSIIFPSEFTQDVTLKTYVAGSWVAGVWTVGAETTSTIRAVIQPMEEGAELQRNQFGTDTRERLKIYTEEILKSGDKDGLIPPDLITYDGSDWEVESARKFYSPSVIKHTRSIIVRKDAD